MHFAKALAAACLSVVSAGSMSPMHNEVPLSSTHSEWKEAKLKQDEFHKIFERPAKIQEVEGDMLYPQLTVLQFSGWSEYYDEDVIKKIHTSGTHNYYSIDNVSRNFMIYSTPVELRALKIQCKNISMDDNISDGLSVEQCFDFFRRNILSRGMFVLEEDGILGFDQNLGYLRSIAAIEYWYVNFHANLL
jgi:hypothetical protein